MAATLLAVSSTAGQGTSIPCDAPSGVTGGILLIAFHSADAGALSAMTAPTGGTTWSQLTSQAWSDGEPGTKIWWKVAGGSEPSSYTFGAPSSADSVVGIAAIIGAATSTPVFASSASGSESATIPSPSVTPTEADDLELRWVASANSGGQSITFTPPAGYTEQIDRQSGTFTAASLATKQLSSGGATGVQNFTGSRTAVIHMGLTVAVTKSSFLPGAPVVLGQAVQRASYY